MPKRTIIIETRKQNKNKFQHQKSVAIKEIF